MDKLNELQQKQIELLKKHDDAKRSLKSLDIELNDVDNSIKEIQKQMDAESFKFLTSHLPVILEKIAPKHKVPNDRNITMTSGNNSNVSVQVPYTSDKNCSDENPFNVSICPRCALLHFHTFANRFLADYLI